MDQLVRAHLTLGGVIAYLGVTPYGIVIEGISTESSSGLPGTSRLPWVRSTDDQPLKTLITPGALN